MELTIGDMAKFMKKQIPVNIPETYAINARFQNISGEEDIRNGVIAYRGFLYRFCDYLIADSSLCAEPKKGKRNFTDGTTLTVEFPFINNIRSILINIGYHGILSEKGDSLLVNGWETLSIKKSHNKYSTAKIPVPQMMKGMRLLTECGINFDGIDLSVKKPDVSKVGTIKVTYPDNLVMLIGLKVLSIAQEELTNRNGDILFRCNYRVLKDEDTEITSILQDFVHPLSADMQDFVLKLHQYCMASGMECDIDLGVFSLQLIYSYKGKTLWRFAASLNNGYRIILKTKHTSKYTDVIMDFPEFLQKKILKGYGCDRKAGSGHGNCHHGCEGFRFSLNDSVLDARQYFETWFDNELSCMQRNKRGQKTTGVAKMQTLT